MTDVTITRLGHHGDGIAEGPIFVPLTLPGEVISGDLTGDRIDAPRIVMPSPDRVAAPCKHFKRCGGCALQHASDQFVESWKAGIVETALAAHGISAPIRRVLTSAPQTRRRATFAGRRVKSGALVGFHGRGSDTVFEVPECRLVLPELLGCLPALQDLTLLGASRKAAIALAVTWTGNGADIFVTKAKDLDRALMLDAVALAQRHDLARLTWNHEIVVERAAPEIRFDAISVAPPPGAFLQATQAGEDALRGAVQEIVTGAPRILDLFAGCGTFALPLAQQAEIHAVENDAEMLAALDRAWRHGSGLRKVTTETRDLFRRPLVPLELNGFDAAVIDPPRAGAEAQISEIAASALPVVAMVSCNPVTFARDSAHLKAAGFSLNWIDIVDQFRWSPHIELVGSFSR